MSSLLQQRVQRHFQDNMASLQETLTKQSDLIVTAAEHMAGTLLQGGKILNCGNGASSALAQYMTSLLLNRYERERPGLPALALTADPVSLMAVATDVQYKVSLARQIRTLGQSGDLLLAMSAGQNSAILREAITAAYDREIPVILLNNEDSAGLAEMLQSNDIEIRVPVSAGYRTQEIYMTLIHCLCDIIDIQIFGEEL